MTDPLIEQLKEARHRRGVATYVVAGLAGLAHRQLYHAEAGEVSPTLGTLRAWADALDCDIRLVPISSHSLEGKAA